MLSYRDLYSSLLDPIPLGICVLQSAYQVVFWNRCLEDWTGIGRDRIEGQSIYDFFPHLSQGRYTSRIDPIFTGGPPTIFSSQLHQYLIPAPIANGKNRIQHTTVTAIPALEGSGFYAMLSLQDVTDLTFRVQEYRLMRDLALAEAQERKLAQERAEVANRAKDEFLAIVSHELRTPLNPILGWAKLLCGGKLSAVKAQSALETILRNATLQAQLIDDLLDVSRILRGQLTLNLQIVDLAFVIYAALDTVGLMAENKAVTVRFQHDSSTSIYGDAVRLQQIVWNLLSNAIKFTPQGGRVDISLSSSSAKEAILLVQDTGIGISADFLPYVFESFRQADGSTTRRTGGLGLGLAITRHLTEMHGGTIAVESTGVGRGSAFTLKLPLSQSKFQVNSQPVRSTSSSHLPSLSGIRVLAVEDEPDARDLLEFVLQSSGAIVISAASVAEALEAIDSDRLDLIVTDIGMPEADGFDLIQTVRSRSGSVGAIPAISLSAYTSELTQQQALSAGFQRHLPKPLNPYELLQAASELVTKPLLGLKSI